jgi:hypothetical protein
MTWQLTEVIVLYNHSADIETKLIKMENGFITISLDLSKTLYRVEDDLYEVHLSLYTEPKKGILVWQEAQTNVQVKDTKVKLALGINRPVKNLLWAYQLLFLEIDFQHRDRKVEFDHRFKIQDRGDLVLVRSSS